MSIWVSGRFIGWSSWNEGEGTENPDGGEVRAFADGWSNHYPTVDGEVEATASVDLAWIPPYCVPGHEEPDVDYETCGPWLRLGLTSVDAKTWWTVDGEKPTLKPMHADVVMDEAAVRTLVSELHEWLERPKVYPYPYPQKKDKKEEDTQ